MIGMAKYTTTVDPAKVAKSWRRCFGSGPDRPGHLWNRCTKHPKLYKQPRGPLLPEPCAAHGGVDCEDDASIPLSAESTSS
jgi:hypothetical protein